jgi:hypothetical protein
LAFRKTKGAYENVKGKSYIATQNQRKKKTIKNEAAVIARKIKSIARYWSTLAMSIISLMLE